MKPIAVLIPGIMGSTLEYDRSGGNAEVLWGENFHANYKRLIDQPGTLNWTGNPAHGRLVRGVFSFNLPFRNLAIPFKRVQLWDQTIRELSGHPSLNSGAPVEFAYDWRAPLEESAVKLRASLDEVAATFATLSHDVRFIIVAHSMGGLLLRIALGTGIVDPAMVERVIYVGTPFRGAPSAFRSAYHSIDLPLFQEVFRLFNWKNQPLFKRNLLESMRTFPSLYYLFPPRDVDYLFYSLSSRSNPLREKVMESEHQEFADRAQEMLIKAEVVVRESGIKEYAIHTSVNSQHATDLEYRAVPLGLHRGYQIEETAATTLKGDGTVPSDSARGDLKNHISVRNVDHAFMCNHQAVTDGLLSLIPRSNHN